ncbi:MAG TPA: thiosulfate oxidation carrier protein SoxY [Gammaproteobacteria bacterium]|nr:thiosulfate oxidation carrier protein SoxY [Gammaproteobacteria bacterium]
MNAAPSAPTRRVFLRKLLAVATGLAGALSLGLGRPALAAWPARAFAAKTETGAEQELFAGAGIADSAAIRLELPALAEDGSVVPLTIDTDLPAVESISVFSDKNPFPLIARFEYGPGAIGGYVSTHIKLAESAYVTVIAQSQGRLCRARKFVTVLKGGCN